MAFGYLVGPSIGTIVGGVLDELCRLAAGFLSIRSAVAPLALAVERSDRGRAAAAARQILDGRWPDV